MFVETIRYNIINNKYMKYIVSIILLVILSSCDEMINTHFIDDEYRLKSMQHESHYKEVKIYKGITLGDSKYTVDSLLNNDSTIFPLSKTFYYKIRKGKDSNNTSEDLYYIMDLGSEYNYYGSQKMNELYGQELSDFKEKLKKEPVKGTIAIDYYLDDSYSANIVIEEKKEDGSINYIELNGCFFVQSYQNKVYSMTLSFNKIFTKQEEITSITKALKMMLSQKYGRVKRIDNVFFDYLKFYSPKKARNNINIVDSYAWLNGRNEVQLLVNNIERSNSLSKYEFIIRYIDNKLLFESINTYKDSLEKDANMKKKDSEIKKQKETELLKEKFKEQQL